MTAVLACGHRAAGWVRLAAVSAIQAIDPCRPSARNSSSRPPAVQAAAAEAKRQASKPNLSASARIGPRGSSEVEVVIVAGRGEAWPPIGQQRTEGGARLDLHVPGLHARKITPRNVAEIVDHREMPRAGEVGEAQLLSREHVAGMEAADEE